MKAWRALALATLCFIDLRVRAEDPVLNAEAGRRTFTLGQTQFVLSRGGLARRESAAPARAHLVRGTALVTGGLTLITPYARFRCEGGCEALFTRLDDSVAIESLTEGWSIQPTGDAREYAVGVATRVVVGAVDQSGRAPVSTAEALPWASLIERWARIYVGGPEKFTARVHAFRGDWDGAVERLSDDQRGRALAMVHQHDELVRRQGAARRAEALEDARIAREYRARNYVTPAAD